jgi:hypothetical protein
VHALLLHRAHDRHAVVLEHRVREPGVPERASSRKRRASATSRFASTKKSVLAAQEKVIQSASTISSVVMSSSISNSGARQFALSGAG